MPKVLISDELSPRAAEIFRERGVDVDVKVGLKKDELIAIIGQYDGLAIRSATKVTADVIAAATNLKVIGRAGIGVDNVDIPAATARGIIVMNTPFGNSITTAEHAIAMIFALARDLPAADRSTQAGKWEKNRFMGIEVTGKTLGLIGCGNIGSIVANRAVGLHMKVAAYDPFLTAERATELGVEKVELDELFRRADFITLHTPLTDATRNIINKDSFAKMKDGVCIINCARGGLIVEEDLAAALDSGKVAKAALDVFAVEPAKENPLFGRDNLVATPHLGASTNEAQENVALQVAEQIADYLMDGAIINALNTPSVSAEDAPKLNPYIELAGQIGSFAGQMVESSLKSVTVEYVGQVATLNTKPLTAVVLEGLLAPQLETVNKVNAPVLAKERNISVSEVKTEKVQDYTTLIKLTIETEHHRRTVAGTLFGNGKPRIVEVAGINIEAELAPHMLYITNDDKPGFIGALGTALGKAGVNIATFALGRPATGDGALALLAVDEPVTPAVLAEIAKLPSARQVKALKFA